MLFFADSIIARCGTGFVTTRVIGDDCLGNVLAASYDLSGQVPQGPLAYTADRLDFGGLGFVQFDELEADGSGKRSAFRLITDQDPMLRIDMVWAGQITATATFPLATINVERLTEPGVGNLDSDIAGPLPADPDQLEAARRTALLARIRAAADDPTAYDEATIDWLLAKANVTGLAELIASDGGDARLAELVLSFTPIRGSTAARKRTFPVSAAILVRDPLNDGSTLAAMLQASRVILQRLAQAGVEPKPGDDLPRGRAAVVWIVPESWFDQDGWPGTGGNAAAKRASRIAIAASWLAAQGIALNPIAGS